MADGSTSRTISGSLPDRLIRAATYSLAMNEAGRWLTRPVIGLARNGVMDQVALRGRVILLLEAKAIARCDDQKAANQNGHGYEVVQIPA